MILFQPQLTIPFYPFILGLVILNAEERLSKDILDYLEETNYIALLFHFNQNLH
jgi:hypothetical protein